MSILVRFTGASGMTSEKYDQTMPTIEASGEFPPDGLDYHVAFSAGGSFRVSEIWDSREQFEAFGQRLMPILMDAGVELAGPPEDHQAVGPALDQSVAAACTSRSRRVRVARIASAIFGSDSSSLRNLERRIMST